MPMRAHRSWKNLTSAVIKLNKQECNKINIKFLKNKPKLFFPLIFKIFIALLFVVAIHQI